MGKRIGHWECTENTGCGRDFLQFPGFASSSLSHKYARKSRDAMRKRSTYMHIDIRREDGAEVGRWETGGQWRPRWQMVRTGGRRAEEAEGAWGAEGTDGMATRDGPSNSLFCSYFNIHRESDE